MAATAKNQSAVVRNERGLSISGTRITLYDVMDYLTAGWPLKLIRDRLQLTDQQIDDVMAYIESHREEVDQEYQIVLRTAEENRQYWEERNKERLARNTPSPLKPDQEELRAKLKAWKDKQGLS